MASLNNTYKKVKNKITDIFNAEKKSIVSGAFDENSFEHFDINKWSFEEIKKGFDRSSLTQEYEKQFDAGKLRDGDIYRIVMQHDFLASVERAYRIRCKSRCDIFIGGVSTAAGLASQGGVMSNMFEKMPLLCEPKP